MTSDIELIYVLTYFVYLICGVYIYEDEKQDQLRCLLGRKRGRKVTQRKTTCYVEVKKEEEVVRVIVGRAGEGSDRA